MYEPPLKDLAHVREACQQLGRELARAGYDLAVFSSKPKYVEQHVVTGYAEAFASGTGGRVIGFAPRNRRLEFVLPPESTLPVEVVRDTSGEWEVSYYRTLMNSDGVLLVGGGQSTRVAGIVAMAQRVPVLPVAAFGGGAGEVWVNLDKVRNDAVDEDIAVLGEDWSGSSAERLVACLSRQVRRRQERAVEEERSARSGRWSSGVGMAVSGVFLLASLGLLVTAGGPRPAGMRSLAVLVGAPLCAAGAGAVIRNSFESDAAWVRALVRGLGAGLVSVLLYFASQLLAVPGLFDAIDVRRLLFFAVPLGFSAGFTFDLVYERLRAGAVPEPLPASAGAGLGASPGGGSAAR
ncbi:hypothetical protein J2S46_000066 [Kitasatospora herbaricolor]|uniref:hypothetical protein n=1 Tax=Kitasatospora herbaricolor TaxID=68217 RepID=UPI00174ADC94|nr:hypothetical protein [Kitasatospora herbaricolor]MDQ0305510.1 hypothetical protein [Kitasatospora herbaricolor]